MISPFVPCVVIIHRTQLKNIIYASFVNVHDTCHYTTLY